MSHLLTLLTSLEIPPDFSRYEDITDDTVISRLTEWKANAHCILNEIKSLIEENDPSLSVREQANVISATAPFTDDAPWVSSESQSTSKSILSLYPEPNETLVVQVLTSNIKPLFLSNPHPQLNLASGRKLARPAGGPLASQDLYEGQTWKMHPGVAYVVLWCVQHVKREDYDHLWHLIIPPVMTLLDDYEARYKLRGVKIIATMLQHVPKDLLKRTGVDTLLRSSLTTCLSHLDNPETPQLLQAAIVASLSLTDLTTVPGGAERFDQLCALLGEGIIAGIWVYAAEKPGVVLATLDALPPLLHSLGIGCARFLKALIPQLVHPLKAGQLNSPPVQLQLSSLRALAVLIQECAPRMPYWRFTILDGVGRCWVAHVESGGDIAGSELAELLRGTCQLLAKSCPSVRKNEYQALLVTDTEMFAGLVGEAS